MAGSLRALALRDLAILGATLALWWLDASLRSGAGLETGGAGGMLRGAVAVTAGALTALSGYLAHEWGHLAGALAAGAVVHPAPTPASVFLFRFDTVRSDRRQFLGMSYGGFLASALVLVLLLALLPLDALSGRVALGLVALGLVATFALEVPVAWRVGRGAPLPSGAVYTSAGRDA